MRRILKGCIKWVVLTTVILMILVSTTSIINFLNKDYKSDIVKDESVAEVKNKSESKKEREEQIVENKKIENYSVDSSDTEKKENIVSNESTSQETEIVKEEKQQEKENANQVQPSSEVKEEQITVPEKKVETPKNNPWDILGITEYEYYNTPAHSWAELDFKISDYGSREATLNACNQYGNEHKHEYGGGFECLPINNYNGDYIGEDIDFY